MAGWWVIDLYQMDPSALFAWVVWIVVSIVLHELSHGWTAIRMGDDTPRHLGRMTLNPLVHIPPIAWVVFAVFGMVWGSMPVDPSRMRGRHADAIVSLAGPMMNLSIAVIVAVVLAAWEVIAPRVIDPARFASDPFHVNLLMFMVLGVHLNLAMMLFNLAPVPPLDGSRILASYWRWYDRLLSGPQAMYVSLFGLAIAAAFFWRVIAPAAGQATDALMSLTRSLF